MLWLGFDVIVGSGGWESPAEVTEDKQESFSGQPPGLH